MIEKNDKGFTLIELIVSMVISSIVIGAMIIFMSTVSKSFMNQENEITLQSEAQVILNQIRECVLSGNNVKYDDAYHVLYIYHSDGNEATTTDAVQILWFNDSDKNMYLYDTTIAGKEGIKNNILAGVVSKEHWLGEHVSGFSATPISFTYDSTGKSSTILTVNITMKHNNSNFVASEDIKLRNKIVNLPTTE